MGLPDLPRLVLALPAVLFVPGWLLLFGTKQDADPIKRLGMAVSTSLAASPLVLLWTSALGWHLTASIVLAAAVVLAAVSLFFFSARRIFRRRPHPIQWADAWQSLPVALILALALITRFVAVGGLVAPMWVDSYHHVLISTLIQEHGALPADYSPYAPLGAFTYHFGFHASAAFFAWIAGMGLPQTVLVLGQLVNGAAVLSVYLLASSLLRERSSGVAAALIVGLVFTLPAAFVNWGRYTLLTGLILLPAAFVLAREYVEAPSFSATRLLPASVALAGMALVHYAAVLFLGCLLIAFYIACWLDRDWRNTSPRPSTMLVRLIVLTIAAGLLLAPWMAHLYVEGRMGEGVSLSGNVPATVVESQVRNVLAYAQVRLQNDWLVVAFALLGGTIALAGRKWKTASMLLWVLLLLALPVVGQSVPGSSLPGSVLRNVSPDNSALSLFLPLAVLAAYAIASVMRLMQRNKKALLVLCLSLALAGIAGSIRLSGIRDPELELVKTADLNAFAWVRNNTPADAIFLTNVAYWQGNLVVGTDGGYWLPLFANRKTLALPALYSSEKPSRAAVLELRRVATAELAGTIAQPQELCQLREEGVGYVYAGAKSRGMLGQILLSPGNSLRLLYDQDAVSVFEIVACPPR